MRLLLITLFSALLAHGPSVSLAAEPPLAYPISTCMSCGELLGEEPVLMTHSGRELQFCSLICVSSYTKSPETYISNLNEQITAMQRDSYPLTTCLVSGHTLGSMGKPVEYVSGNTLVKFCCGACIETFEKDKEQMLKKLSDAGLHREK